MREGARAGVRGWGWGALEAGCLGNSNLLVPEAIIQQCLSYESAQLLSTSKQAPLGPEGRAQTLAWREALRHGQPRGPSHSQQAAF